jgi:hypothetical protein
MNELNNVRGSDSFDAFEDGPQSHGGGDGGTRRGARICSLCKTASPENEEHCVGCGWALQGAAQRADSDAKAGEDRLPPSPQEARRSQGMHYAKDAQKVSIGSNDVRSLYPYSILGNRKPQALALPSVADRPGMQLPRAVNSDMMPAPQLEMRSHGILHLPRGGRPLFVTIGGTILAACFAGALLSESEPPRRSAAPRLQEGMTDAERPGSPISAVGAAGATIPAGTASTGAAAAASSRQDVAPAAALPQQNAQQSALENARQDEQQHVNPAAANPRQESGPASAQNDTAIDARCSRPKRALGLCDAENE